jgi:hypothetical protein
VDQILNRPDQCGRQVGRIMKKPSTVTIKLSVEHPKDLVRRCDRLRSPAQEKQAHSFLRGLTLTHMDARLRRMPAAERFLAGDVQAALAARGVNAVPATPSATRSSS